MKNERHVSLPCSLLELDILSDALEVWNERHEMFIESMKKAGTRLLLKETLANHKVLKRLRKKVAAAQKELYK